MDLKSIYKEVIKKYETESRRYLSLSPAEQALVDAWRINCKNRENIYNQMLSLKWYEFFKEQALFKLSEQNHKDWTYLFNQLDELGILDKMRQENA